MRRDNSTIVSVIMILQIIDTIILVVLAVLVGKMMLANDGTAVAANTNTAIESESSEPEEEVVDMDEDTDTASDDLLTEDDISTEEVADEEDEPTEENLTVTGTDNLKNVFHLPDNYYLLNTSYKNLLKTSMNLDEEPDSSLVVIGDTKNVTTSNITINATTYDNIGKLYEQLYDDFNYEESKDDIKSTAYIYHTTGTYGDNAPLNYSCKKIDEFTGDSGIKYTAYDVEYDTDYNDGTLSGNEAEAAIVHTRCVTVYGDTDDVTEIIVFCRDTDNIVDTALPVVRQMVGAE